MSGHGEKLNRKQEQAVAALLEHDTLTAAADAVGVNEKTLRAWLKLPHVQAAYHAARAQVLERATALLLQATTKAVERLVKNIGNKDVNASTRAAVAILTHAVKAVETLDLAGQVAELREQVSELKRARLKPYAG
jgi:HAMP domain-containing protein